MTKVTNPTLEAVGELVEALRTAERLSCGQFNDTSYDIKQRLDETHRFLRAALERPHSKEQG